MGRRGSRLGVASHVVIVVFVAFGASIAAAHTSPVSIPPAPDYMIRWYQPHGARPVDNWEIEIATQKRPGSPYVVSAQVMPDASCWALNVPVNEPATVRVRSVAGAQVSAWSRTTTVPEPGTAVGAFIAAGALAGAASVAERRRRLRARAR